MIPCLLFNERRRSPMAFVLAVRRRLGLWGQRAMDGKENNKGDITAEIDKAEEMAAPLAWWKAVLFALVPYVLVCLLFLVRKDIFESTKVCVLFMAAASLYWVLVGVIALLYYKSSAKICLKQLYFVQEMKRIRKLIELVEENDKLSGHGTTAAGNPSNAEGALNAGGKPDTSGNQDKECKSGTIKRIIEAEIIALQNANR